MDWSASDNLSKFNKMLHIGYWVFVGFAGGSLIFLFFAFCITGFGTTGNTEILKWSFYSIIGNLIQAGIWWSIWCFTKGFEKIVEASEYTIYQIQKNDKQPITNK